MRHPVTRFLIAPALLAAACGAHAQGLGAVTLYGLVDVSVGRTQAPGGTANNGIDSGRMSTSYWGVKGQEDLGSGMKAVFALESFMRSDTGAAGRFNGDAFWARNAYVGLGGSAGELSFGRNTTSLFVQTLIFNAFGDSFGFSPSIRHYFTSGTVSGDTGWNDSVKYQSPRFGGASFTAHAALGESSGGKNLGVSGLYFGGPLALGAAWQKVDKGAAEPDTTSWQLAASYDMGAAKFFGQYGQVDNRSTANDFTLVGLGLSVPVGTAGKLMAQVGQLSPNVGNRLRTTTLGYGHALSKRTDVYATLMSDRRSNVGTGNSWALGVRHRF